MTIPAAPRAASGFVLLLLASAVLAAPKDASKTYPKAPTADVVDEYHGTKVPDPYRPLENPDAPETRTWIDAQNKITEDFLASIPERAAIRERLKKLWNFERYSVPFTEGGRYFYSKNDGLQNQSVLYVMDKWGAPPRLLLDPNKLSKDGTVALAGIAVSDDGKLLAYGTAASGSDWNEWHVRDVDSGADLADKLEWVKFSGASWTNDGKGFFYSRYDEPAKGKELEQVNKNQKVYYHRVGTPQADDVLVYARPDQPEFGFGAQVSNDGRWLLLNVSFGTDRRNRLYVRPLGENGSLDPESLKQPDSGFVRLVDELDSRWNFLDNVGSSFLLWTDKDAPRGRVVSLDFAAAAAALKDGKKPEVKDVVPQPDAAIQDVDVVGNRIVVKVLKDAASEVRLHALDGKLEKTVALPTLGTVGGFGGKREQKEAFYAFTSFTYPTTIYRYDFATGTSEVFRQPKVAFDPATYETRRVLYTSKDGTKVPLFVTHKKGLKYDGSNPTILTGYGGFSIAITPAFSISNLVWMEMGGVLAQACLRGGSEYGEEWHRAGMLDKKQNVFDDFIAAGEWLVKEKVTSSRKLAIRGGSNGGLLVGAVLNQRPDLFGAAIPAVGVMDMLRFQKFTIGWAWVSDYGTSEKPEEFKWLRAYSPLHNIKKGAKYPSVMITTADHDDRVVPAHSFKYAAALQAAQGGDAPVLIRIETKAGHGAGKPTSKQIEEAADVMSFLAKSLGGARPVLEPVELK